MAFLVGNAWFNFANKVKQFFRFSHNEVKALAYSIILLTFMVAFNDGRTGGNIDAYYVINFIIMFLFVTIAVLGKITGQKLAGLVNGFRTEYVVWWYGLLIGIVIMFISRGTIWILVPGSIACTMMPGHRLGKFRYGLNYFPLGWTAAFGPITNIILAIIFKIFTFLPVAGGFFEKAVLINVIMAILNMFPIPPMDGSMTFFGSRVSFVFSATLILAIGLSLLYLNFLWSMIVVIGVIILVIPLYIWFFEQHWWG